MEITGGRGVKVVYDSVGRDTFEGSLACLQRFGLLLSFGDASGPPPPLAVSALAAKSLFLTRQSVFSFLSFRARRRSRWRTNCSLSCLSAVAAIRRRHRGCRCASGAWLASKAFHSPAGDARA